MQKIILLFLIVISYWSGLIAQDKRDYVWLLGDNQLPAPDFGAIKFDFNVRPFTPAERKGGLGFDQNTASICDKDGRLLFYSNGCLVLNSLHQTMPNGDSINHGEFLQNYGEKIVDWVILAVRILPYYLIQAMRMGII